METSAAAAAFCGVDSDLSVFEADRVAVADFDAVMAANALVFIPEDFSPDQLAFRIGAPPAAQGTSFQEDDGTDPRAVVDGEFLNIEYNAAVLCHNRCLLTSIEYVCFVRLSTGIVTNEINNDYKNNHLILTFFLVFIIL